MRGWLVLAFLAVPIAELWVILQVAHVIGGWTTLALLIAESFLGAWLVRREGRRTWQAFQSALQQHRQPGREVADGALVIVGGALLLTPGFLSDILGFFVLVPPTRPLARRLLLRFAARRVGASFGLFGPPPPSRHDRSGGGAAERPGRGPAGGDPAGGEVIEGEVLGEGTPDGPSGRPPSRQPPPNRRRPGNRPHDDDTPE